MVPAVHGNQKRVYISVAYKSPWDYVAIGIESQDKSLHYMIANAIKHVTPWSMVTLIKSHDPHHLP